MTTPKKIFNAKMLKRVRTFDATPVFWSRIGWSDFYGMALAPDEAEFRRTELSKQLNCQPEEIEIIPYQKVSRKS